MDYSRFTPKARSAIQRAYNVARGCSYVEVTPSILMVAIIQEARDMVFFLLQQMDVDKVAFCQSVSDKLTTISQQQGCQPDVSENTNRILQQSLRLSSETDSALTGVEHIFWAFSKVRSELSDVFRQYAMSEDNIIRAVRTYRSGNIETATESEESQEDLTALAKYARNLNTLATDGKIEPSIGRDEEVRRILQILSRKTKNNPILVR